MPGRSERFQDVTNIWQGWGPGCECSLRPGLARYVPASMEPYGLLWVPMERYEPYGALWSPMERH